MLQLALHLIFTAASQDRNYPYVTEAKPRLREVKKYVHPTPSLHSSLILRCQLRSMTGNFYEPRGPGRVPGVHMGDGLAGAGFWILGEVKARRRM